jgi:hypothetical protein
LLLAAGTDSAALHNDEGGPYAGHRGILFATFSDLCLLIYFAVFGDLGFFPTLFQPLCLRDAHYFGTGADPTMSSEV